LQSASGIGGMPEKRPLIKIFSVFFCVPRYRLQASWSLSMNCWFSMPNCVLIPFSFSYSCRRFRFLDTGNTKKRITQFVVLIGHECFSYNFALTAERWAECPRLRLRLFLWLPSRICNLCFNRPPQMSIRCACLCYSHVNSWQTKTFMITRAILKSISIPACVERLNWVVTCRLKINH